MEDEEIKKWGRVRQCSLTWYTKSVKRKVMLHTILASIQKKSTTAVVLGFSYLVLVGLFKWQIKPPVSAVWYLTGGILGIYFLDIAETLFTLHPSPFRSIVFAIGFVMVSFFVVTSSGSFLATGLVFSLYLTLILWMVAQYQRDKNLDSWYTMIAGIISPSAQRWILIGFIIVFLIETFLFVR